jgi:hypothetical protein
MRVPPAREPADHPTDEAIFLGAESDEDVCHLLRDIQPKIVQ